MFLYYLLRFCCYTVSPLQVLVQLSISLRDWKVSRGTCEGDHRPILSIVSINRKPLCVAAVTTYIITNAILIICYFDDIDQGVRIKGVGSPGRKIFTPFAKLILMKELFFEYNKQ